MSTSISFDVPALSNAATTGIQPPTGSAAPQGNMQQLSDRFSALMAQDTSAAGGGETTAVRTAPSGPSSLSQLLLAQEQAMRQTMDKVQRYGTEAPSMDTNTLTARTVEISMEMSMVQTQFKLAAAGAQSCKSGLQTLMKNQ